MIGHRSSHRSAIKLVYFGSGTMVRVLRSGDGRSGRCYLRLFNAVVKLLEPLAVVQIFETIGLKNRFWPLRAPGLQIF